MAITTTATAPATACHLRLGPPAGMDTFYGRRPRWNPLAGGATRSPVSYETATVRQPADWMVFWVKVMLRASRLSPLSAITPVA
jgi:hypothetical protein